MPRAKFIQEHLLNGNPSKLSKKDLAARGLQAYGEVLEADYIPDDATQCIELIKKSMPPGVYTTLDTFLVNAFAVAWAVHKRATEELFGGDPEADKFTVTNCTSGTEGLSGWYKVFESSTRLMASLATQLGLDPRARQQMTNPNSIANDDEDKELLGS